MGTNVSLYSVSQIGRLGSAGVNHQALSNYMPVSFFRQAKLTLLNYETNAEHNTEKVIGRSGPIITYSGVSNTLKIAWTVNTKDAQTTDDLVEKSQEDLAALEGLTTFLHPIYDSDKGNKIIAPPLCELIIETKNNNDIAFVLPQRRMIGYIKEFSYNIIKNEASSIALNPSVDGTRIVAANFDVSLSMDLLPDKIRGSYIVGNSLVPVGGTYVTAEEYKDKIIEFAKNDLVGKIPPIFGKQ